MIRSTRTARLAVVAAAAALVLSSCGSDDDGGDDAAGDTPSSSDTSAVEKTGDGTLVVGSLLPTTGDLAFLGPPEIAGVDTAITDINAAGGVNGADVTHVEADSGDGTPNIAPTSADKLLSSNADVIVGAASSSVSLSVIDKIVDAGVVQFSPANTSTAFDTYDDKGMYFRTAPSDVLQGAVMANLVTGDGYKNVAILARQDSYGEALADQVEKGIKDAGANVVAKELYSADASNFTAEVTSIAGKQARRRRADRLQRDHQDHPDDDRQGHRPEGPAGLLRRRQHRRLLRRLRQGHAHRRQGHLPRCRADR